MTKAAFERLVFDWASMAGDQPISVEEIGGGIYAFGSELACLRLWKKYRRAGERAKAGFSENKKSWYFRLEVGS